MPAQGPGEAPPVVVRRRRRVQRQQQQQQAVQRAAQNARPLARTVKPPKPKQVVRPLAKTPKPPRVTTASPAPQDIHTDVRHAQRATAVHVYDQLDGKAKRARFQQAQNRVKAGRGDEGDKAVVHIHDTRVAGNRKRAAATGAFNAITGTTAADVAFPKHKETTRQGTARLATAIIHPSGVVGAIQAIGAASAYGLKSAKVPKIVQNVPKDVAEIAVTTPSSIAKLGSDVAHHPAKVPGELAAPYRQLVKDPKKFVTEHPVSAALMVAPAARMPGRAAGRVLRLAGKQTLERPAAALPHTPLRQTRTGSRDAVTRAVQARRDVKRGAPQMTQAQVQRRVDEFYDYSKQHVQRAVASAAKEAKQRGLSKDAAAEHVSGARGGARDHHVKRMFAQEFGAPHVRTEQGNIVRPHSATRGTLHDSRAAADAVTQHLNEQGATVRRGAHGLHQAARRNTDVPLEFQTVDAGYGQFASVPKAAAERLHKHQVVGSSKAPGAQYMRVAGRSFRGAVLPLSARWLFGQVGEAGLRAGVAGAGPADLVRFNRVVREMNKVNPGSGDRFIARVHGGQFDLTGTAREFANGKTLAEELKGTAVEDFAHGATRIAQAAPLRKVRQAWNGYSRVVFDVVNGQIETTARKAMAGQAIKQGPLMQRHLLGLTDRAIHEAARGLQGTETQVQAARAVDRMYGQYQKFSPEKREHLLHTTPFYPWYRNVVTFLTQTLPVDHPLKAALVADLDAATEDWRKTHGLSLRAGGGKPGFLLGSYPVGTKGQTVPAGRYMPFVPGQPLQAVGDLFLPQYANAQDILKGKDWKGKDIKGGAKGVGKELAKSVVEAHIPGVAQVDRIIHAPSVGAGVKREVSPFPKTRVQPKHGKGRKLKKKQTGGFAGFGSSSSGFAGF